MENNEQKPTDTVKNDGKFKKGNSAGKKGRPKGTLSLTELLRAELSKNNFAEAKKILEVGLKEAKNGNHKYFDTFMKYIDGLPKQKIELSGDEQNPLNIIFKVDKPDAD